jgi:hypothetical protein
MTTASTIPLCVRTAGRVVASNHLSWQLQMVRVMAHQSQTMRVITLLRKISRNMEPHL